MRITFWHILATTLIILGLSYYFIPFVRYLLIPFSGGTKAPESLMIRFLEINTAIDTQTQEPIFSDGLQQVPTINQVPEQGGWINSRSLDLEQLYAHNKCVLISFWNLGSIKCLRSMPHIQDLWVRYKDHGLMVIGVHSPTFSFEKDPHAILAAIERMNISFPILTDGNKKTWKKFGNHFSPGFYLINPQGIIIYTHFEEGSYDKIEHAVRECLKKSGHELPQASCASTYLDPIIRRSTPELYAGAKLLRKPYGNQEQPRAGHTILFALPSKIDPDKLYVEGMCSCNADYIQNKTEGKITVNYLANAPYFALAPTDMQAPVAVEVLLDGQPLPTQMQGPDIQDVGGKKIMMVNQARLYYPIEHKAPYGKHIITLIAQPGLKFYSTSFGTY